MELIDTHCHLFGFAPQELSCIIARASDNHVSTFICVGAGDDIKSAFEAVKVAENYKNIWAAIGIHPHDADTYQSLEQIEELFSNSRVKAIGETGLDFYRDWADKGRQQELFKDSIAIAKNLKLPLIIHCREALEETFLVLKQCGASEVGGVFHCFAGDSKFAKRLEDLNFLVSFTGSVTFKNASKLRETVKEVSLSQMMLETDSPYMAPEPFRGEKSEPAHVYQIALKVAQIKDVSVEEVAKVTTRNACRLFNLMNLN